MKKSLVYILLAFVVASSYSCSEDSLSSESVIKEDTSNKNEFDMWLLGNYTKPYNINFKYRMEDIESDMSYYLVPADYKKSIKVAHLVKHLCLDVFDEVVGPDFTKRFFPKLITLVGSAAYNNNGTYVVGSAEGGLKITLYKVNDLDPTNIPELNENYFKTIHHEFTHILNQTVPYPVDFDQISSLDYVSDSWNKKKPLEALKQGFVSPYASKEANEDFAELVSVFVTSSEADWNKLLKDAGVTGSEIILRKFEIVANYMKNVWGFNIVDLRDVIQRRSAEVPNLNLDELK